MALWTAGTLLWLLLPSGAPEQLITRTKSSLQRLDGGIEHAREAALSTQTDHSTESHSTESHLTEGRLTENTPREAATTDKQSASIVPVSNQPAPALRAVYSTTAEQLNRDYEANGVATQSKIGNSRVRVTGNIAEIDQDAVGRPVVTLWTGKDSTAEMTLVEDQRAAAAQLAKGEAVEIECGKIGRNGDLLQGDDCTLALIDFRPKEVNLALVLANENRTTRVYVVGPMSEAACVTRSAEISSRLQGSQRGEHVVSRNCTEAARDRIPPEGCRLNASSVSIPDVPTAHLWRYDCSSSGVAHTSRRKRAPTNSPANEVVLASAVAPAQMEPNAESSGNVAAGEDSAARAIPLPVTDAVAVPAAPATAPASTAAPVGVGPAAPASSTADHLPPSIIRVASASNSDTGTTGGPRIPAEESTVAHATQSQKKAPEILQSESRATTSPGAAATPDDLARVRAADPQAANHIASYCAQTTVPTNRDTFISDCRRSEAEAWTRLVLQNEFPTLDEATRRKCSEPPFPDTYVAKESCARYVLHVN